MIHGIISLFAPENISLINYSLIDILWEVHSLFVIESLPGDVIQFSSKEISLGSNVLCFFEGVFNFKAWLQECEIFWKSEVEFETSAIKIESQPEEWSSSWMPNIE